MAITNLTLNDELTRADFTRDGHKASGSPVLMVIQTAWAGGVNFEDLADGFGKGLGTNGGDWSGIRDSSTEATAAMFERAIGRMRFGICH